MARVLIAEDESTSQRLLASVVERLGHAAVVCPNGKDALHRLITERRYDLLITDVAMPEMDGCELVTQLRQHVCMRDVPVILVSGVVGPKQVAHLLDTGVTLFLPKPIDLALLQESIDRCLAMRLATVGRQFREGLEPMCLCAGAADPVTV